MKFDLFEYKISKKPFKKRIFLAGSGRSGTTWLADLINFKRDFRYMFEPFHNEKIKEWSAFNYRQYFSGVEDDPVIQKAVSSIFDGRINSSWTDKFWDKKPKNKLLIKDIRANLMLKWFRVHYPEMPVILLVRHPGAVIHSKMRLNWTVDLKNFLLQSNLVEDHLQPFMELMNQPGLSIFQQHAMMWCIENYIPFRQFKAGEIQVIFYEDLVMQPERQLKTLFNFIAEPYDAGVMELVNKPSALAKRHNANLASAEDLISGWKNSISPGDRALLEEIIRNFGMDRLYDPDGIPQIEELDKIMQCKV
jgi:hypothetical protein